MLQDPMVTNLAMSYGKDFVGRGQQEIQKSLNKYVSIGQLKVNILLILRFFCIISVFWYIAMQRIAVQFRNSNFLYLFIYLDVDFYVE